jgi:hypothetical protein
LPETVSVYRQCWCIREAKVARGSASHEQLTGQTQLTVQLRIAERDCSVVSSERRHKRTSKSARPQSRHSSRHRSGRRPYEETSKIQGQASGVEAFQDAQDETKEEQARNHAMKTRGYYDFDTGPTVTTLCWSDATPPQKPRRKRDILLDFLP